MTRDLALFVPCIEFHSKDKKFMIFKIYAEQKTFIFPDISNHSEEFGKISIPLALFLYFMNKIPAIK